MIPKILSVIPSIPPTTAFVTSSSAKFTTSSINLLGLNTKVSLVFIKATSLPSINALTSIVLSPNAKPQTIIVFITGIIKGIEPAILAAVVLAVEVI